MNIEPRLLAFIVVSAGFAWLSRSALLQVRSHGFYRFFAWESILMLILLNLDYWFRDPLTPLHLISWLLLLGSLYLVMHSFLLLIRLGKPDKSRVDPALIGLEKTTELVTVGVYRYIRHPIYGALLLLAWGAFFKQISAVALALTLLASIFLVLTARMEESENIRYFGPAYREYMARTKMFVPFLF